MQLTGKSFVGSREVGAGSRTFRGSNPATSEPLEPVFVQATSEEIDAAARKAEEAFKVFSRTTGRQRAGFLVAVAEELEASGEAVSERITLEAALPAGRNASERGRTANQMRMFARLIEEGSWVDARVDHGDPQRAPVPKPDLRRMLVALGPVAVFGASNFPQAYSVAGGDTASALAAGCTVVVKAHPSHPGVSELTLRAVLKAAARTGMPDGVINMVHGIDPEVSIALVKHPAIKAVGFTGSLRAGRALMDAAASRAEPIPVYAEMSSLNPLFILPGAIRERAAAIAEGLKNSVTNGVGQFCTKPGLLFAVDGPETRAFAGQLAKLMGDVPGGTMLNAGIAKSYQAGTQKFGEKVTRATPVKEAGATQAVPALFTTTAEAFLKDHSLAAEVFGPTSLLVLAKSEAELEELAGKLEGQLTASIHAGAGEVEKHGGLVESLKQRAGRLIFNGYPTGVEVNSSQHHGGPYPATSDGRTTSVGTAAIQRFARPVAYQDWPDALLPAELREGNPLGIRRTVDGQLG